MEDITFRVEEYFMRYDLITPFYLSSYWDNLNLIDIIPVILNMQLSNNALLGNLAGYII